MIALLFKLVFAAWLGEAAGAPNVIDARAQAEPGPTPVVVTQDAETPEPEEPVAEPSGIETADDLLRALEASDDNLRALSAAVQYTRDFAIAGDRQVRKGRLNFVSGPERTGRRFSIGFTSLIVGKQQRDEVKLYIFDGEWLVEKLPQDKQYFARQVAPPGEEFDPLKIGEGPFPIPIGQRREDILREYDAKLAEPGDGLSERALVSFAKDAYQLVLTPREEIADDAEFLEVRLWYSRDDLLPRMARTVSADGDETTVQLVQVKLNAEAEISPGAFDTTPPAPGSGWDVDIRAWREPAG